MFACLFAVVVFSCFVNCIFFFFVTICCCCCRFCFVFAFLFCFVLLFCLVLLCQGWPRLLACIASWPSPYTIVVLKVYRKKKKKKRKLSKAEPPKHQIRVTTNITGYTVQ